MIQTEHLNRIFTSKKNQAVEAVKDLTLQVNEGEVFGFLGPNGAGKTTTVRILAALISPSSGAARINGFVLGKENQQIRQNIGILTESPGMYDRLSAEKNLTIYARLYDVKNIRGQVEKYLRLLGLWERRKDPAGSFSKGMKQKLAIARALIHEPKILFLDEPTSALDPEAAHLVRDFIEELRHQGKTIFLCTHNLDEADRLCDRIAIFRNRLVTVDTPSNLRKVVFGRKVVFHMQDANPAWPEIIRRNDFVEAVRVFDKKILVNLQNPEEQNPVLIRQLVEAGAQIQFVGELRYSLEETYLQVLHEKWWIQNEY